MSDKRYHIESQVTNYLAGECSQAEELVISGLIESDSDYRTTFIELSKIWNQAATTTVNDSYDIEQAWDKVSQRTSHQPLKVTHRRNLNQLSLKRITLYAANVAAVLLIGFFVIQYINKDIPVKTFASLQKNAAPINLADGSHIVLNSNSELKFPEKFGSHNREVYFWGEAFFEIASDPTRPFVIETGEARVQVVGTSFNLRAIPNTGITEVVVNSGTVLFYYVDKNDQILGQITLQKGEKGTYTHATGKLTKSINDDLNFISWKTGTLVFSETPLDRVMEDIGKKYDVSFRISDPQLSKLKLTATFDNDSLEAVLEVVKLVHKLQITNNGKDYLVSK